MVNGVLYSPKYNYIAYYCAKSGCSSLKHLFIDLHKEELSQDVQSQLISHTAKASFMLPNDFDTKSVPKFILVRNPYLRAVSMYINKYVGEQFLDNSSNNFRKLNSFFVNDMRINYTFNTQHIREIAFILAVYNLFNEQYESNGYTYTYINGGKQTVENFYFPQAGINFMAGLSFKF